VDRTKPAINRTRMDRITYYLKIADLAAERSTCHIKAGCVITRNNRITAIGYNGAPPGQDHCLDKGCLLYKGHCIRTVHCEINCLTYMEPKRPGDVLICYLTMEPCINCYKALVAAGVGTIYCSRSYKDEARELLEKEFNYKPELIVINNTKNE